MRLGLSLVLVVALSVPVRAQQAVQLPVISGTSVNTTVSVPDRGSTYLGGVSSALSGRSQYGPLRSGTSRGLSRQATSITTNVFIHDLQAMDEDLLNSESSQGKPSSNLNEVVARLSRKQDSAPVKNVSADDKAAKFEQLARRAEEAGKPGTARLHWQVAAKYGSKVAETRLAELSRSSKSLTSATKSHEPR